MITVLTAEKGGSGKSTAAFHFVASYFLDKNPTEPITIYEVDAHNRTVEDFVNDEMIHAHSVKMTMTDLERMISEAEFDSVEKDIVIDVGGSDNTYKFLDIISNSNLDRKTVFLVPEINKRPRSAENTIRAIREKIKDPNIVILLNRYLGIDSMTKEEEFKFFYGDDDLGIEESPLASDTDLMVATLPNADVEIGLAETDATGLWTMSQMSRAIGDMLPEEKMKRWGENGKPCDRKTYLKNNIQFMRSRKALVVLDKVKPLYGILDTFSKKIDG